MRAYYIYSMKKLRRLFTPGRIILVLLVGLLIWFFLLPKVDKFELIGALFVTIVTLFSMEGALELLPDSWLKPFKRKERNPLLEK